VGRVRFVLLPSLSITHVDTERAWRGGQQALLTLARGLGERGHAQRFVCPPDSELARRLRELGFEVLTRCPRDGDIVHAHSGSAHNVAVRATLGSRVRRVVTRHVAFAPRHPLVHRLKYAKTCHGIIAVSESVRRVLLRAGIPSAKIEVIHTGVEIPPLAPRPSNARLVVGHMGAFTREKGQDLLMEAARALPHVEFLLAGEGPLLAELRATAPRNVRFPGFVSDPAAFFSRVDLFVMPSRSEAWGLAALEAMAHGVPTLAANIEGLAEIVEPACLFPPNDPVALAAAIEQALREPDRLAELGKRGRRRAADFSVAGMAAATEAFYMRVLGRG
jgi:glycosyltransferase involved in cell wall biosynthesis